MIRLTLIGILFLLTSLTFGQTMEDKQAVIQMSIDLPSLQPYYLQEKPLIIANDGIVPTNLALTKYGEPVAFLLKTELFFLDEKAFLDFEKFEITPTQAAVVYRYDIKGLTISLIFEKNGGNWSIKTRTLTVD